ncbi:MAG: nodulation protein NfeD [Nitrospinae bacterium]|nr:nodulation protein NfeD [Nitrospinota bacterium]
MKKRKSFPCSLLSLLSFFVILPCVWAAFAPDHGQSETHVDVLTLTGLIAPFTAQYVVGGIERAEADGAQAVIIQMDTPGGLMTSMDEMIKKMLGSRVPVIVYVAPPGARAGSAGVFMTMAAHIAAMAPTTNIGAAHPIGGQGEDIQKDLREKVTNDAVARIRALASARGRNAEWAEEAVRRSVSIAADQALELRVIDLMANSLDDLLAKIEGRTVNTGWDSRMLHTKGARQHHIDMSWSERFLHTITEPNIAYILLSLGTIALIAEFYHPGAVLPGLTGVICLVVAFTAFGILQPNWAGVGLILLALIFFLADLKVQSYALSVGGAIAFVLGSIFLFKPRIPTLPSLPEISVSPWLIAVMTAMWVGFFAFVLMATVRAHRAKLSSGANILLGAIGVARTDLTPHGIVLVQSEEWSADAIDSPIQKGERVQVVEVLEGLHLRVIKALP